MRHDEPDDPEAVKRAAHLPPRGFPDDDEEETADDSAESAGFGSLLNIGAPKSGKAPVVAIEAAEIAAAARDVQLHASGDLYGSGEPLRETNVVDFASTSAGEQDLSPAEAERRLSASVVNAPEQTPDDVKARCRRVLPEASFGMAEADMSMNSGEASQVPETVGGAGESSDAEANIPADEASGPDDYHRYALDPEQGAAGAAASIALLHATEPPAHGHRLRAQIGASLQPEDEPESWIMGLLRRIFGWIWQ
ncbi:hypothetical protein [Novosphingobium album (ex Hu et al. 2023)]|uniref:DUF3306 domain-containing protein n=1 Tax=Novosphingobium album (ex Hu et al. 2023) TaxID=2930093 RepID=A0ABT0AWX8_9SPHN|nr:hypothetical protein [Novosphingobium album (ex Hu et al. 2023)]MCJ2177319.1 hypothetical protein [Novosphingobium album (ex Hu et al. 2023)]